MDGHPSPGGPGAPGVERPVRGAGTGLHRCAGPIWRQLPREHPGDAGGGASAGQRRGYVLAAVVSFAAACALTLTCVRLHQRAACRKTLKQDEVEENQP